MPNLKITLTMTSSKEGPIIVDGKEIDEIRIEWRQEYSISSIMDIVTAWNEEKFYLTTKMTGLERVGESTLTLEQQPEMDDGRTS